MRDLGNLWQSGSGQRHWATRDLEGIMRRLDNFVGGESVAPKSKKYVELINPATGEPFAEMPVSNAADVDAALQIAHAAFQSWKRTTPSQRSRALQQIADILEAHAEELVAVEAENCGKIIALTMSEEIPPMIDQIRFFAGAARLLEGRGAAEYMEGMTSYVRREPIGVCGAVTPWNYPMMMAVWKWAPAIAAGNTMVLKPGDSTPASTVLMAQLMAEVLPPGVFNVVCGDRDTGRALVEHAIPAMVSVTGSVRAGMEVASSASQTLKRVHLELRWQGAGHRLRRRRHRLGRGEHRDRGLLQRRPGLHRGDARARRAQGLRRLRGRAGRTGEEYGHRSHPTTTTRSSDRSTTSISSSASPVSSAARRDTRRSRPAATRSVTPATSSSRRSSPTSTRTTR